jgi:DNA-binding transcriptional MerR regulator/predicted transcriptional regulator YdeE/alkylated DNA nucleotide flippase Atl1
MFKIGVFSKLVQVPIHTLRYYDQIGLLKPNKVDPFTGYRYYSASQIALLHRIVALRGLGFSLEEIHTALEENVTAEAMSRMLRLRYTQINHELREAHNRLLDVERRLQQIEHEHEVSRYDVIVKQVEPQLVALVRATVPNHAMIGLLFSEVYQALGKQVNTALGPQGVEPGQSMVLWYDTEYKTYNVDGAAAFVLRHRVPDKGNMEVVELPACTMATTIHHGSYDTIHEAHEALLLWIDSNGYQIVGPEREVYLYNTQPVRRDDPSYITEVQYTVEPARAEKAPKPKGKQLTGVMEADEIVPIPEKRVKFFGTTGKMLLPSPATLAAILNRIQEKQIVTTEQLSKLLAEMFEVEAVCPVTTRKSLSALANDPDNTAPFWRVVKPNGELTAIFPGGVTGQAELLMDEGVGIDVTGKSLKIKQFKDKLAHFN